MVNDSCYDFDTRCDCCRVYITGSNRACSTHHYIFLLSPRSCSGSNGHSHRREKAQTVEDIRIDGRAPTSHLNGQRISLSTFWLSFVGTVEPVSRRDPSRSYACPSATVPRRGDPQVTSPADHGGLRHLRRTTHPPLARHPCGRFSSLSSTTACSLSTPPWSGLMSHERLDGHLGRPSGAFAAGHQFLRKCSLARALVRFLHGHTRCLACSVRYPCCVTLASRGLGGGLSSAVRVRSSFSWAWHLSVLE
jgi:hypothetical protein